MAKIKIKNLVKFICDKTTAIRVCIFENGKIIHCETYESEDTIPYWVMKENVTDFQGYDNAECKYGDRPLLWINVYKTEKEK